MIRADLAWFAHDSFTARALRGAAKLAARRAHRAALSVGRFVDSTDPTAGLMLACVAVAGCYAVAMVLSGAW